MKKLFYLCAALLVFVACGSNSEESATVAFGGFTDEEVPKIQELLATTKPYNIHYNGYEIHPKAFRFCTNLAALTDEEGNPSSEKEITQDLAFIQIAAAAGKQQGHVTYDVPDSEKLIPLMADEEGFSILCYDVDEGNTLVYAYLHEDQSAVAFVFYKDFLNNAIKTFPEEMSNEMKALLTLYTCLDQKFLDAYYNFNNYVSSDTPSMRIGMQVLKTQQN